MHSQNDARNQSGFSLPELLVAMAVMLIILASVFSLMGNALTASNVAYELTDAQQSLRTAQEYFNRDLTMAGDGLLGLTNTGIRVRTPFAQRFMQSTYEPDNDGFAVLSIVNSDNDVAAGVIEAANASGTIVAQTVRTDPNSTDRVTMLTADPDQTFTPIDVPLANINPGGTNITVTAAQSAQCNIGDILFISNGASATFGTVTDGCGNTGTIIFADDVYQLNTVSTGAVPGRAIAFLASSPLVIQRMLIYHYFVDANGLLHKRTFGVRGGIGFTDSVIAERVTNLQIRYNLYGTGPAPTYNLLYPLPEAQLSYVPSATARPPSAVRQVETAVTVETAHNVVNNQRRTVNGTTTSSLRNMEFRNALRESLQP